MNANVRSAISQYGKAGTQSVVEAADPHRLIQMLMEGALDKIAIARGAMERNDFAVKGEHIGWAVSIINGLRGSLDKESGGEVAENLDALYEYMGRRLMEANSANDITMLDEVSGLLREIKSGWDSIPDDVRQDFAAQRGAERPRPLNGSVQV